MKTFELLKRWVGADVLEIFGDTGTGKSKFCYHLAKEVLSENGKVLLIDSERNLQSEEFRDLGDAYVFNPTIEGISRRLNHLPSVDLLIIDSVGFPVLVRFADLKMRDKGDAMLTITSWLGKLKDWCYRTKGLALVTNQPKSEMSGEPEEEIGPFGGKSAFAAKEIWRTQIKERKSNYTKIEFTSFRSRWFGFGLHLADFEIKGKETSFSWKLKEKPPEEAEPPLDAEAQLLTHPWLQTCPIHQVSWVAGRWGLFHSLDVTTEEGKPERCELRNIITMERDKVIEDKGVKKEEFFSWIRGEYGKSWTSLTLFEQLRAIDESKELTKEEIQRRPSW